MHSILPAATGNDKRCTCLLMRRAARRVSQLYDEHLRPAGLRTSQFSLLAQLRHADGMSIGDLATRLSMDRTTLTRNLRPLTDAGWIASVPDPDDRRRTRLALTASGREMLRAAAPLWRAAQRALRERLGASTVAGLHALLDTALAQLD